MGTHTVFPQSDLRHYIVLEHRCTGFSHSRWTKSPPTAVTSGMPGGAGGSYGALALIGFGPSNACPMPFSLTALTRNRYSWFSVRPMAMYVNSLQNEATVTQLAYVMSLRSTT